MTSPIDAIFWSRPWGRVDEHPRYPVDLDGDNIIDKALFGVDKALFGVDNGASNCDMANNNQGVWTAMPCL